MRKHSKSELSVVQEKIWTLCRQIIRHKYGNVCYTCNKPGLEKSNWQTGHVIPKGALGAYLKYDLRLLRPQCYNCNIHLGGNGAIFIEKMRDVEGNKYVNQIIKDRQVSVVALDWYNKLLPQYEELALKSS